MDGVSAIIITLCKLPNAVSVTAWNNLFRLVGVETRESGKGKVVGGN